LTQIAHQIDPLPLTPATPATAAPLHLIVPWASASAPACQHLLPTLALPALQALLGEWTSEPMHTGNEWGLNAPHEAALAAALGWSERPDGCLPLAAWHADVVDTPCAWFSPCHWHAAMDGVTLRGVPDLAPADAQALLQALRPLAEADGLQLHYETPTRWRAEGEPLRTLPCASLDRVWQRPLHGWLPERSQTPAARTLQRLQSEAQMLFYTHPVYDRRTESGLLPVNAIWVSGTGALSAAQVQVAHGAGVATEPRLREAALAADWPLWLAAWAELEHRLQSDWLPRARAGAALRLSLCGERNWQTWVSPALATGPDRSWLARWRTPLRRRAPAPNPATLLASL